MIRGRKYRRTAFSLVELVIVVVIIGIVSAIAVPRMSNAAQSAKNQQLFGTISVVSRAMELYRAEHGQFPGYNPVNGNPSGTHFANQLLQFTDESGRTNATLSAPYIYGPYLRPPFPTNLLNELNSVFVKATATDPRPLGTTGWVSVLATGEFGPNASDAVIDDLIEVSESLGVGDSIAGTLGKLK